MTPRQKPLRAEAGAGPLDEVIAAEQSQAARLSAESARAAAWLTGEVAAIDGAADAELAAIAAGVERDVAAHQAAAALAAAAIVREAEALATRLDTLDADRLAAIVCARLGAIVPKGRP